MISTGRRISGLISYIPGFPACDVDHSLTFLIVCIQYSTEFRCTVRPKSRTEPGLFHSAKVKLGRIQKAREREEKKQKQFFCAS
jgi:hypothetical protein